MSEHVVRPPDFRISVDFAGTEAVLGLAGTLDALSAPELGDMVDTMVDRGHYVVVLDLGELDSIDTAGLSAIASTTRRLQSFAGTLTVRSPSERVRRVLEVTNLTDPIAPKVADTNPRLGPEQELITREVLVRSTLDNAARDVIPVIVIPPERGVLDSALRLVVNLAKKSVGGADGVSISLLRDGQITTVAASDQTISRMDASQYATKEGPCLDASIEGHWFHVDSIEEETRWPAFVPMARALGIQAILSNPLIAHNQPIGALNIYSLASSAFGPVEQELAATFAAEASIVLSEAGLGVSGNVQTQRLREALRSREVIAQAQGVVMERASVGEEAAFDHLRRFSQLTDRPLRERAEDVVASTRWPEPDDDQIERDFHD